MIPAAEKKKTDILKLKDIRFFKNGSELNHADPHLEHPDSVSLNFTNQKNRIKENAVLHQCTGDIFFCHVETFAKIMK